MEGTDNKDARKKGPPWWISFLGGLAGGIGDTVINYPPYGVHIRKERKEAYAWWKSTPRMIYCGSFAYGFAMIPTTVVQLVMTDYVNDYLPRWASAFLGGMIGAIIYTPVGNIIVNQQKLMPANVKFTPETYVGMRKSINHIVTKYGYRRFYTGLGPTMVRDGIYSMGVFGATDDVQKKCSWIKNEYFRNFVSALIIGTMASPLSHPMDAIATRMQDHEGKIGYKDIIKKMWNTEEVKKYNIEKVKMLYRGAAYRWFAVVMGIFVVETISTKTTNFLNHKYRENDM